MSKALKKITQGTAAEQAVESYQNVMMFYVVKQDKSRKNLPEHYLGDLIYWHPTQEFKAFSDLVCLIIH